MRALAPRWHDLSIVRSDKRFFDMAVSPRYGVKAHRDLSEEDIAKLLQNLHVQMVIAQDDLMVEQPAT